MFGIGGFEFFIIIVFAFLVIGPDKLPELAKSAGKFVAKFRSAKSEMDKVIKTEVYDPNAEDPFQTPINTLQKMSTTVETAKSGETFAQRKARYEAQRAAERGAAAATAAAAAETAVPAAAGTAAASVAAATVSTAVSPEALFAREPVAAQKNVSDTASEPADSNAFAAGFASLEANEAMKEAE